MATLRQVEKVTATFPAGDTSLVVALSTTLLTTARTAVFFSYRVNSTESSSSAIALGTVTTTSVEFLRGVAPPTPLSDAEIIAYVVEFTDGVFVERGEITDNSIGQSNTLGLITDINKTFALHSVRSGRTGFNQDETFTMTVKEDSIGGIYTEGFHSGGGASPGVVRWQAIEYDDCVVQHIANEGAVANTENPGEMNEFQISYEEPISLIDMHKAFINVGYNVLDPEGNSIPSTQLVESWLDNPELVKYKRNHLFGLRQIGNFSTEVVEFTDNTFVQQVRVHLSPGTFSKRIKIQELSDYTNAVAHISTMGRNGRTFYDLNDTVGESFFTIDIENNEQVNVQRESAEESCNVTFYIVEFDSLISSPIIVNATEDLSFRLFDNENYAIWKFSLTPSQSKYLIASDDIRCDMRSRGRIQNIRVATDSTNYDFSLRLFSGINTPSINETFYSPEPINKIANYTIIDGFFLKPDINDIDLYVRLHNHDNDHEFGVVLIEFTVLLLDSIDLPAYIPV